MRIDYRTTGLINGASTLLVGNGDGNPVTGEVDLTLTAEHEQDDGWDPRILAAACGDPVRLFFARGAPSIHDLAGPMLRVDPVRETHLLSADGVRLAHLEVTGQVSRDDLDGATAVEQSVTGDCVLPSPLAKIGAPFTAYVTPAGPGRVTSVVRCRVWFANGDPGELRTFVPYAWDGASELFAPLRYSVERDEVFRDGSTVTRHCRSSLAPVAALVAV